MTSLKSLKMRVRSGWATGPTGKQTNSVPGGPRVPPGTGSVPDGPRVPPGTTFIPFRVGHGSHRERTLNFKNFKDFIDFGNFDVFFDFFDFDVFDAFFDFFTTQYWYPLVLLYW